jgi:hypothetical protein
MTGLPATQCEEEEEFDSRGIRSGGVSRRWVPHQRELVSVLGWDYS